MSAQNLNSTEAKLPEWFDPFPEPHTLPYGWNLDSIVPKLNLPTVKQADASAADACG